MRALLLHFVALPAMLFGHSNFADGQVILDGCSASLTNQPTTTAKLVDINLTTGAASNPRDTGIYALTGIATQPVSGNLFGLTSGFSTPANSLIHIDPSNGAVTVVGSTGLPLIVEGDLAFNPLNGFLYGVQDLGQSLTDRNLFRINALTGLATVISNLPSGDYSALAFIGTGLLYAIDTAGNNNSYLMNINPTNGAVSILVQMNVNLGSAAGLAINPITGVAYVADGGDASGNPTNLLFTVDLATGLASSVGPTGVVGGISGLAFIAVPEPSSLFLVATAGLSFLIRRMRQSTLHNTPP
jgi:hypothetical protein